MLKIFNPFKSPGASSPVATQVADTDAGGHAGAPIINDMAAVASPGVVVIPNDIAAGATATEQALDAMAHDRECKVTIGEAQLMFKTLLRRPLSQRSLQRYCANGTIAAQLYSHSQGKEWLMNETSLIKFIERYPITLTNDTAAHAATSAAADEADQAPESDASHRPDKGVATPAAQAAVEQATPTAKQTSKETAKDTAVGKGSPVDPTPVSETTKMPGGAKSDAVNSDPSHADDEFIDPTEVVGESRRLADILIENARLTALLSGKAETIEILKSHGDQMHQQMKESNALSAKLTTDVVKIASQMLHTMEKIGTAGRVAALPEAPETETPVSMRLKSKANAQD